MSKPPLSLKKLNQKLPRKLSSSSRKKKLSRALIENSNTKIKLFSVLSTTKLSPDNPPMNKNKRQAKKRKRKLRMLSLNKRKRLRDSQKKSPSSLTKRLIRLLKSRHSYPKQ